MPKTDYIFTSESVSEGHPDKVSDRISDSIVDLCLAADPHARVALETLCTTNHITLAGEVRVPASVTHEKMIEAARQAVNAYIRTNATTFDAFIDFDAAVRDNSTSPPRLLPAYDSGDGLHLNPAGYRKLADTVDLALFTR